MSDIKINNITSFGGSNGPVISGITTAEGSFFGLPRGDTAYRGGRGRGIFGGGRLNSDLLNNIDYITISTTGDARVVVSGVVDMVHLLHIQNLPQWIMCKLQLLEVDMILEI